MDIRKTIAVLALIAAGCPAFADSQSDAAFAACKTKLQKANELGVLYAFDWKPPKEPYVVVGRTFFGIAMDAKEGFAETLNCFLMAGESGKCVNFDVLHWQTGKAVGRFRNCKLKIN
jgi:hypothetical protein